MHAMKIRAWPAKSPAQLAPRAPPRSPRCRPARPPQDRAACRASDGRRTPPSARKRAIRRSPAASAAAPPNAAGSTAQKKSPRFICAPHSSFVGASSRGHVRRGRRRELDDERERRRLCPPNALRAARPSAASVVGSPAAVSAAPARARAAPLERLQLTARHRRGRQVDDERRRALRIGARPAKAERVGPEDAIFAAVRGHQRRRIATRKGDEAVLRRERLEQSGERSDDAADAIEREARDAAFARGARELRAARARAPAATRPPPASTRTTPRGARSAGFAGARDARALARRAARHGRRAGRAPCDSRPSRCAATSDAATSAAGAAPGGAAAWPRSERAPPLAGHGERRRAFSRARVRSGDERVRGGTASRSGERDGVARPEARARA